LRRREKFAPEDVERIDIDVDAIVPTILIHDRPVTGLEAKFSMPFCVAAAVAFGGVGIDAFEAAQLRDPRVAALMPRVAMRVDPCARRVQHRRRIRARAGRQVQEPDDRCHQQGEGRR